AGRTGLCLAVLARDPRICAADLTDRFTCQALATGDASRCLGESGRAARCRRELARVAPLLPEHQRKGPPPPAPTEQLEVTANGPDLPAVTPSSVDLSADVAAGLVIVETFEGLHVELGVRSELGGPRVRTLRARGSVFLGHGDKTPARLANFELDVPGV